MAVQKSASLLSHSGHADLGALAHALRRARSARSLHRPTPLKWLAQFGIADAVCPLVTAVGVGIIFSWPGASGRAFVAESPAACWPPRWPVRLDPAPVEAVAGWRGAVKDACRGMVEQFSLTLPRSCAQIRPYNLPAYAKALAQH